MAMVTAVRGTHVIRVSKRSFETMFKNKGYTIIDKEIGFKEKEHEEMFEEGIKEEQEKEEEIETIPISEMNKEQLAEYAKEHNIDTSGARNVREARQIIQKAIREEKM